MKPPYRLPSMAEIAALPFNGYRVASTFSGCGGSSLGYRLAGFRVVWANEFVPAAQETYRANFPTTRLDERDIRVIEPRAVLDAAGLAPGELDVLDGSPPCASFSMAGKRQRDWGRVKPYSDTKQRTDDLFVEYARLVDGLRPRVFVAENVSGLVKGVAKGQFLDFLAAFKRLGYRVRAQVLDAQWLGVPQARQRLIFLGVRDDLGLDPAFPTPLPYRYSVRDALPEIGVVSTFDGAQAGGEPAPTVLSHGRRRTRSQMTIETVHLRTKRGARSAGDPAPAIMTHNRRHTHGEFVVEAESDMTRFAVGAELDKLRQGEQSSRYFQLVRAASGAPSPTITVEGKKAHAASVAHPIECRKFTIAELRAICGFPADFVLTGTYAQQWERLGRAVPPPMMAAIAATIRDRILVPLDQSAAA